jgi:hypothetical protein
MKLPIMVLACKCDLPRQVDPRPVALYLRKFDVGLVEVDASTDNGKAKMQNSFGWLFKAIFRDIRSTQPFCR